MNGPADALLLPEAVGSLCSQVHFGPWTLLLLTPVPRALFLRAGPHEETSLHTECWASSPGPSLSGRRTTVGNQNTGPCVKMIQNSGWQEQAVQAECGVPCDHATARVSQEEASKGPPTSGEAAVCRRAEMQRDAVWPTHLAGVDGGGTPPGRESTQLQCPDFLPVLCKDVRYHQAAFLPGEQGARLPGVNLPPGLAVLFTDS